MDRHPIESLMGTTMENIRDMVDVNTVVGDPVQTADGVTVIPISRVSFGFVAGGGEYSAGMQPPARVAPAGATEEEKLPFAGGSGAGVCVQPMGFLITSGSQVKLLSANCQTPIDRVVEMIPQLISDLKALSEQEEEAGAREKKAKKPEKPPESMADSYAFTTPSAMEEIAPGEN